MAKGWIIWKVVVLGCFCGLVLCKSGSGPQNTEHQPYTSNKLSPKSTSSNTPIRSHIIVDTKQGKLKGIVDTTDGTSHTSFLGVPYALPPTGALRFKEPARHLGWTLSKIYDATSYKPACLQGHETMKREFNSRILDSSYKLNVKTSENCLYLNIYIPKNLSTVEHINTLSLPVMIFIHGWDFENEVTMLHDGSRLATHGKVIVASISYRVGVFGFLSLHDKSAKGNFGLLDQQLAIHWIWDNIREFGGNPEKITVFGGLSGASSIGFHMISPLSRGLFMRAISQSGNMLSPDAIQHNPRQAAFLLAEDLNCPTSSFHNMLTCLKKVPADKLLTASISIVDTTQGWLPVVDGEFLPDEPLKLMEKGKFNPVNYLVGFNNFDGYVIQNDLPYDLNEGISQDEYEDLLGHYTRRYISGDSEHIESAVMLEYAYCGMNQTDRGHNIIHFATDLLHSAPSELVARLMTRKGERSVYMYVFSQRPSQGSKDKPEFIQADHGKELPFVLGDVQTDNEGELRLSTAIMNAWTNFAKTGYVLACV